MDDLIERTRLAAKILRDIGGQSAMAGTVEEAAAALEAAREDAEDAARYKWLRDDTDDAEDPEYGVFRCNGLYPTGEPMEFGPGLDAAIDQARGKGGGE